MIRSLLFNPGSNTVEIGSDEALATWVASRDLVLWLDIGDDVSEKERSILREFGFHPLAIQDAMRKRHPPKIESYSDHLLIILRDILSDDEGLSTGFSSLSMFLADRLLVTVHARYSLSIDILFTRASEKLSLIDEGPAALAIGLCNHVFRRYVKLLIGFEPRLDELEDLMFDRPNDELLMEITQHKSKLRHVARSANYHKLLALILKNDPPKFIDEKFTHEILDSYEQVERSQSLARLYYDVLKDLSDGYLALSSHRLNRVMQILTVITVIFVPLTFLAGIYGMNFEYMPELSSRPGYFIVLGIMLTAAITQLILFRRKRWL